ncbi:Magnetosome protein Mad29 [Desulfovibrionales bacterium]
MAYSPRIVSIVGPKGGVGKSTISANLAIALARSGAQVVAMDLDLGSANLHVLFGIKQVTATLDDFLLGKIPSLDAACLATEVSGLILIAGGNVPGIANLPYQRKVKLIRHLSRLSCDYLLLDLAPGATLNVVDFALLSRQGVLVTTPDVPSLMNLYSFIKTAVHRRLGILLRQAGATSLMELLELAKDPQAHPELKTMEDFYARATAVNPELTARVRHELVRFQPLLLINRVKTPLDLNAGRVVHKLMREYLSLEQAAVLGLREDRAVSRATARLRPVLLDEPGSAFAADLDRLVRILHATL